MLEVDFFAGYALSRGLTISHSVCSFPGLRLLEIDGSPSGKVNGTTSLTDTAKSEVATVVIPSETSRPSDWLSQKRTRGGQSTSGVVLCPYHGMKSEEERMAFLKEGAIAFWAFPDAMTASKQLGPIAVARKASRYVMRYGMKANGQELEQVNEKTQGSIPYF